jgi:translation elongation factor EF-1beta
LGAVETDLELLNNQVEEIAMNDWALCSIKTHTILFGMNTSYT